MSSGELIRTLGDELGREVSPGARILAEQLRERFGPRLRAVLLYGSCLRRGDDEGVLDLYALVDGYRGLYEQRWLGWLNAGLPPNVFSLEARVAGRLLRCKYAVVSLRDFARSNARGFEPYFWARFAQPCALVYAADEAVARAVAVSLAEAVLGFLRRVLPLLPPRVELGELWRRGLAETRRCEVRAERAGAAAAWVGGREGRWGEVTSRALPELPWPAQLRREGGALWVEVEIPSEVRRAAPSRWALRRVVGKSRFLLRLLRNGLIFQGGMDYLAWKIERHSGLGCEPSWREARLPAWAFGRELWRLYRRGAFR